MTTATARLLVCGTDLTEASAEVADVAVRLAAAMAARVHLVHVLDASGPAFRDPALRERATAAASKALDEQVARLAAAHALPPDAILRSIRTGSTGRELALAAEELGALLVVVGAVGPTTSIFRLGGTAERVAQAAEVPVLVLRDAAPLRNWLRGDPLAVAALVGDDAASDRVVEWLRALRDVGACDVAVLHAYYVDEAAARYGLSRRPVVVADPEIEGYLRRELERRVGALGGRGQLALHPVLALGRIADHLVEHPAARGAGLVVVGNHRARRLARLSSVAAGVLHLATSSVLVVPAHAPAVAEAPWPQVRRVVAATDFSPFAAEAVRHGYGLLAAAGGELTILHVVTPPADRVTEEAAMAGLHALVPGRPPPGVTTHLEIVVAGEAAPAIVEAAARHGADCVVVASHGRTGLRRLVLGSVAQGVVQGSHRPVLVVRPPDDR